MLVIVIVAVERIAARRQVVPVGIGELDDFTMAAVFLAISSLCSGLRLRAGPAAALPASAACAICTGVRPPTIKLITINPLTM